MKAYDFLWMFLTIETDHLLINGIYGILKNINLNMRMVDIFQEFYPLNIYFIITYQ